MIPQENETEYFFFVLWYYFQEYKLPVRVGYDC